MSESDFVGDWRLLGTLSPIFNEWQRFPNSTNSLQFSDSAYLPRRTRQDYQQRFSPSCLHYPKVELRNMATVLPQGRGGSFDLSQCHRELLYTSESVPRYFEVCKRNRGYPAYYRTRDTVWSVAVEILELAQFTSSIKDE